MPNNEKNKPRKAAKPSKPVKRRASEGPQTLIIPQISPEMLESARRAASEGKSAQEIEQAALEADARRKAEQAAQQPPEPRPAEQPAAPKSEKRHKIGRASCRERV